jgi:hypothetical protein
VGDAADDRDDGERREDGPRSEANGAEGARSELPRDEAHAAAEEEPPRRRSGEDPEAQERDAAGRRIGAEADAGGDGGEGEDRGGVREREGERLAERAGIRRGRRAIGARVRRGRSPGPDGEPREDEPSDDLENPGVGEEARDDRRGERAGDGEQRVGRRGAEPGDEPEARAPQAALNDENADGPDGGGDGESNEGSTTKGVRIHGRSPG